MKFKLKIICIIILIYLISINYKSKNLILNNKRKGILNLTVKLLSSNEELKDFSGEYEEISSIETTSNNNNKYNIEEIYFLLTTNTQRIHHTKLLIQFWSKYKNIQCIIFFEEEDFLKREYLKEYLETNEVSCQIQTTNIQRYEERYFQLIQFGLNYIIKQNKTFQWFAIGDDDTIWFINNLLNTLKQYNSSKFIYLGNISDRNQSVYHHGDFYAYGGAGILLTKPLVLLISQYSSRCLKQFKNSFGGDEIIGKCITKLLNISLTKNKYFHQIDHEDDIHGLLQSGINGLVTLHHIFSLWEPFPSEHFIYEKDIINIIYIAYQIYQQDFLKTFFKINFQKNQTLLLTIGYSFTLFNSILSIEQLNKVEMTWKNSYLYQRLTRSKHKNKRNWFIKQLNNQTNSIYQNNQQLIQIIFNN